MIDIIASSGEFSGNADISRHATAYLALVRAKESAGQERAIATAAFAADVPDSKRYRALLERWYRQEAYLDIFRGAAGGDERASLDKALNGTAGKEVVRLREVLAERAATGGFGVDPTVWFKTITEKIDALLETETLLASNIETAASGLVGSHRTSLVINAALSAFTLVAAIVISLWIAAGVSKPLQEEVRVAEQAIAANDFTNDVPEFGPAEVIRAGHAFNELMRKFRDILTDMKNSSTAITDAAQSLAGSSKQVRESSAVQADAAAAVAAAVEQASVSVSETSANAEAASDMVEQARKDTVAATEVMARAIATMKQIAGLIESSSSRVIGLSEASQQIGGIIGVIDDIASQTNLLALNAAIEAARAGEQGRGFAVVADEVRKLAERTTQATKEIAGLIESIQTGVAGAVSAMQDANIQAHASVTLVGETEAALSRIDRGSREVANNVHAISDALKEQDMAIKQVAVSIENIAENTDRNSKAAESNNTTAHRLDHLSRELREAVSRFRV